jgi:metal-sulfur cluster biosynthetic enzyme
MTDNSVSTASSVSSSTDETPAWLADERAAAEAAGTAEPAPTAPVSAAADPAPAPATPVSKASIDDIEEAMKDVVDPELGINVVDLGLVYGTFVDDDNIATLDMTLTSAACPLTDVIEEQTAQSLDGIVEKFRINWVWMPPWGPERITDDGRDMMRAIGFSI